MNTIEKTFALIEAAAVAGERCPISEPYGPLKRSAVTELVRSGRIRIEIGKLNYRVIVILSGPNAGKQTAPNPLGGKPYRIIDKAGKREGPGPSPPKDYSGELKR